MSQIPYPQVFIIGKSFYNPIPNMWSPAVVLRHSQLERTLSQTVITFTAGINRPPHPTHMRA
jgi:hypothetical protein